MPPARFERATLGLEVRRSIQLSYGGVRWASPQFGHDRARRPRYARGCRRGAAAESLGKLDPEPVKSSAMSPAGTDPDLTRKERREQARSERKALEAAAAAQAARRTRVIQLGSVIGVVVVIIAVILIATSGGGSIAASHRRKAAQEGSRDGQHPDQGHPAVGQRARQPQGAGDPPVLRRPGVPDLQGVHARRAAAADRKVRAHGQAEDRIPLAGDGDARTGNIPHAAGRGLRRRQAEPGVVLHRALLPRAGRKRTAATSPKATSRVWPSRFRA